jgi:rod shape-determining protein MreC
MRNIILLLRRFSVLIFFLLLQALSLWMLTRYSRSHQARYMELSYEATGRINKKYSGLLNYFSLGENNRYLAEENARLRNMLASNFTVIDTSVVLHRDTARLDTTGMVVRKFIWRPARVINNSVAGQNNYITLERGRLQGIQPDMAVVGPSGIVGIVTDVSDNMAIVMSLLHRKSQVSVMLKNSGITGIVEWDGKNPQLLQLKGIPKSTKLAKGDTVLTSNISLNYPAGQMVGTVAIVEVEKGGNNYLLQIKPGSNFFSLQYVNVVENTLLKEQQEIEQRIRQKPGGN